MSYREGFRSHNICVGPLHHQFLHDLIMCRRAPHHRPVQRCVTKLSAKTPNGSVRKEGVAKLRCRGHSCAQQEEYPAPGGIGGQRPGGIHLPSLVHVDSPLKNVLDQLLITVANLPTTPTQRMPPSRIPRWPVQWAAGSTHRIVKLHYQLLPVELILHLRESKKRITVGFAHRRSICERHTVEQCWLYLHRHFSLVTGGICPRTSGCPWLLGLETPCVPGRLSLLCPTSSLSSS